MLEARKVYQFDVNGNLVAEYPSVRQAALAVGTHSGNITNVCKRKQNSACGFYFSYENELVLKPAALRIRAKNGTTYQIKCLYCGKEFVSNRATTKFCDKECWRASLYSQK